MNTALLPTGIPFGSSGLNEHAVHRFLGFCTAVPRLVCRTKILEDKTRLVCINNAVSWFCAPPPARAVVVVDENFLIDRWLVISKWRITVFFANVVCTLSARLRNSLPSVRRTFTATCFCQTPKTLLSSPYPWWTTWFTCTCKGIDPENVSNSSPPSSQTSSECPSDFRLKFEK